jgi:hypothetical protein
MIFLIIQFVVAVIVLLWFSFHFKNIENKLDLIYDELSKKKK